jgi:hypothetical protein
MPDPIRAIRLSDADWSALVRIAASRGLLYGGSPSRNAAIAPSAVNQPRSRREPKDEPAQESQE